MSNILPLLFFFSFVFCAYILHHFKSCNMIFVAFDKNILDLCSKKFPTIFWIRGKFSCYYSVNNWEIKFFFFFAVMLNDIINLLLLRTLYFCFLLEIECTNYSIQNVPRVQSQTLLVAFFLNRSTRTLLLALGHKLIHLMHQFVLS